MTDLDFSFTYTEDDLKDDFAPLPDGTYDVEAVDAEVKSKPDTGAKFISTTLRVIAGDFEGRRIFTNITVASQNPKALVMGRKLLASLCNAIGMPVGFELKNVLDLLNVPVKAVVYTQDANNGYPARNGIRTFKKIDDAAAAPPPKAVVAQSAAPWKR